jgi:hypothetical protein
MIKKKGGALLRHQKCSELVSDYDMRNAIFSDKCVHYFIEHIETIEGVSNKSLYGMILKLKLKTPIGDDMFGVEPVRAGEEPKYVYIQDNVNNTGYGIDTLICKITFIDRTIKRLIVPPTQDTKQTMLVTGFEKELVSQQKIYANSNLLGEPICPSVLFTELLTRTKSKMFIDKLKSITNYNVSLAVRSSRIGVFIQILEYIYTYNPSVYLGICFMELLDGYIQLGDMIGSSRYSIHEKQRAITLALYQNMRLMSMGYIHSDLHYQNIMIHTNYPNFTDGTGYNFKCIILDFGLTEKISRVTNELKKIVYNPRDLSFLKSMDVIYRTRGEITGRIQPEDENYFLNIYLRYVSGFLVGQYGWKSNKDMNTIYGNDIARSRNNPKNPICFQTIQDMTTIFNEILEGRIRRIDRLVGEEKYKISPDKVRCLRYYINTENADSLINVSHFKILRKMGGPLDTMNIRVDLPNKNEIFDMDIIAYYVSKNSGLIGQQLRTIVEDYIDNEKDGKFKTDCDMRAVYLNSIQKTDRFATNRSLQKLYESEKNILYPITDQIKMIRNRIKKLIRDIKPMIDEINDIMEQSENNIDRGAEIMRNIQGTQYDEVSKEHYRVLDENNNRISSLFERMKNMVTEINTNRKIVVERMDDIVEEVAQRIEVLIPQIIELYNEIKEKSDIEKDKIEKLQEIEVIVEQQRLEQQRMEQQRMEQQRMEQQRMEQQRLEQQRLEQQRMEQQRLEQQRMEQQRLEQQRLEQQRMEQQRMEQQRLEQQRMEQQRIKQEKTHEAAVAATLAADAIAAAMETRRKREEERRRITQIEIENREKRKRVRQPVSNDSKSLLTPEPQKQRHIAIQPVDVQTRRRLQIAKQFEKPKITSLERQQKQREQERLAQLERERLEEERQLQLRRDREAEQLREEYIQQAQRLQQKGIQMSVEQPEQPKINRQRYVSSRPIHIRGRQNSKPTQKHTYGKRRGGHKTKKHTISKRHKHKYK